MPCGLLWHHIFTLYHSKPHLFTYVFYIWWYTVPEFLEHKYCLDVLYFLFLKYSGWVGTVGCVCVPPLSALCALSHFTGIWLFSTPSTLACQVPLGPEDSPGKDIGVGCRFLLHRIFLTKRSKSFLPHWQTDSLPLSYKRRPVSCLLFII